MTDHSMPALPEPSLQERIQAAYEAVQDGSTHTCELILKETLKSLAQWRAAIAEASKPVQAEAPTASPSPTAGMTIEQRILHVGGRNNAAGYVEFGSTQAVQALVRQVLRDLPARAPLPADVIVTMYAESPSSDSEMVEFAREIERAHGIGSTATANQQPAQAETVTFKQRLDELIEQHGSLRAVGRVLEFDAGYLSRLATGERSEPGDALLRRMGLREVTSYVRAARAAQQTGERG